MTTPAALTYSQIETRVMNQLRIPTSNTTEQAKIQALINEIYRDLYLKADWWFLWKHTALNTAARINADSISVTLGSTAFSFLTSDAPSASLLNYVLLVNGNSNDPGAVYRIASSSTSASQTLDAAYTGVTSTSAGYNIYQDSIPLPADCGKVLVVKRYGEFITIKPVGALEMAGLKIADTSTGKPEAWSVYDFVTTGDPTTQRLLQIHPYPDKAYRLDILYKQQLNTELASTTQPFLPDEYRQILIYGALARGYPIFLNDLERGKYFQSLFNDVLALMVAAHREYAEDLPQLVPDDAYRQAQRIRQLRRGAPVTLGTYFDRLPNIP